MLDKPNYCNYTSTHKTATNGTTKSPTRKRTNSNPDGPTAQVHTPGFEGKSGRGSSESQRPNRLVIEGLARDRRKEVQGQEI